MWNLNTLKLAFAIICIYTVYVLTALINERIFTRVYPCNNSSTILNYFVYPDLLQAVSGLCSFIAGMFYSRLVKRQGSSPIPLFQGCLLGCLYTCRVNCLNYALFYVPYTVRAIWSKLGYLATILVSVFLSRYEQRDGQKIKGSKIKTALVISTGAVIFAYFATYSQRLEHYLTESLSTGYMFLAIALVSKGLFIDNQAFCKKMYRSTVYQLLYTVNLTSAILSLALLIVKSQLMESIRFYMSHESIRIDISLFCMLSTIGQFLIYHVAFSFNLPQNMIPLTSMTRNLLSNLLGVLADKQTLNTPMLMGLVLAYGGMVYEIVDSTYYSLTGTKAIKIPKKKSIYPNQHYSTIR